MASQADVPEFDPRSVDRVMKLGGKKKLDELIGILDASAPVRLEDLKKASGAGSVRAAAQSLKVTAGGLGLAKLEDLCDRVLETGASPDAGFLRQLEQAWTAGRKALGRHRAGL